MFGGCFDGVYGVFVGFEVICMLNEYGIVMWYLIDVVVWINEEGLCFMLGMMGLVVYVGVFDFDYVLMCLCM